MAHHHQPHQQNEFLPLCDVLFNIISLASYFCDVVFDLVMCYALANHPSTPPILFPLSIFLIFTSLIISQLVSIRWYLWGARGKLKITTSTTYLSVIEKEFTNWTVWCVILFHITQAGVLWRYFKLFIPVDLTYVKHEVRELCVLRLIHAFCEAAPMLLLQLYLLSIGTFGEQTIKDSKRELISIDGKLVELIAVSAGLSLWSVCWAVASFSKGAARLRNLERLVLTWLGVLAQLAWRLGTVSARVGVLVVYASLYGGQWLLIVLALHWLSMLTWLLLTPDGLFHGGERLPITRKIFLASLLAFLYVFAYVNIHETNHRQKMIIFYVVMFLENSLLIGVWAVGSNGHDMIIMGKQLQNLKNQPPPAVVISVLLALFFGGLSFMGLYYRFFHVRRLRYETGGRMNDNSGIDKSSIDDINDKIPEFNVHQQKDINHVDITTRKVKLSNNGIPGVFNCRFTNSNVVNLNRKKKKPTTFIPPPTQTTATSQFSEHKLWLNVGCGNRQNNNNNSRQLIPFWKRPISAIDFNEDNSSFRDNKNNDIDVQVSTLNIHLIREKLREKKQQQLRELRAIQEEIKEGKLVPPPSASTSSFSSSLSQTNQQPPPNTKLHTSPSNQQQQQQKSSASSFHSAINYSTDVWKKTTLMKNDRPETPEILLAPRCLPHRCSHWTNPDVHQLRPDQIIDENDISNGEPCGDDDGEATISDIEGSQISLPRSYTLPREFKYDNSNHPRDRRLNGSRICSSRFYLPSTNSSDGDVDSADNEDETDCELTKIDDMKYHMNRLQQEADGDTSRVCNFLNIFRENEAEHASNPNPEVNAITMSNISDCSLNYSYGTRANQFLKAKVKHETKL